MLLVEGAEVGDAPAAPGARAEALGDERCDGRVFALHVGADLAEGDVVAEADFVVVVHGGMIGGRAAGYALVMNEDAPRQEDRLLTAFLSERDAACPRCGYSVKGLVDGRCPECGEGLELGLRAVHGIDKLWLLGLLALMAGVGASGFIFGLMIYFAIDMPPWMDVWREAALSGGFLGGFMALILSWFFFRRKYASLGRKGRWMLSVGCCFIALGGAVVFVGIMNLF